MVTRRAFAASLVALAFAAPAPALAQTRPIEVRVGETVEFTLPRLMMIVDSEDSSIATFARHDDGTATVTGVAVGRTRIIGRDYASMPLLLDVVVSPARR